MDFKNIIIMQDPILLREGVIMAGFMGRFIKVLLITFPAVMVLNQCTYHNCYRSDCVAAAFTPVLIMSLVVTTVIVVIMQISDR